MLRSFSVQIKRALSPRLLLLSFAAAALQLLSAAPFIKTNQVSSVWYVLFNSQMTGINFFTIYILPVMVYAVTLVKESETRASDYYIIRTGVGRYTLSKILASATGGYLLVFLELLICMTALKAAGFPWYTFRSDGTPYSAAMEQGKVIYGFFMFLLDMGWGGAVVSVFGLTVSVFIENSLAAAAAPLAVTLFLSRVVDQLKLPFDFNPMMWMRYVDYSDRFTALDGVLYKSAVSLIVMTILSVIGIRGMKRRQERA